MGEGNGQASKRGGASAGEMSGTRPCIIRQHARAANMRMRVLIAREPLSIERVLLASNKTRSARIAPCSRGWVARPMFGWEWSTPRMRGGRCAPWLACVRAANLHSKSAHPRLDGHFPLRSNSVHAQTRHTQPSESAKESYYDSLL